MILAHLARQDGMIQSDLAGLLNIGKAALGGLIDRLETSKFIERRPDLTDRRAKRIYLTNLGAQMISLAEVDRIIVIGSDRMMAAVARARHDVLANYLKPHHFAIGSINSPMQCMMKEICGQCLQLHTDPKTGKSTYVFSCFNQDQPLDQVNFACLEARLKQNSVQEKLTAQWINRCLVHLERRQAAA